MGKRRRDRSSWWTETTNGVQNSVGVIIVAVLVAGSAAGIIALAQRQPATVAAPTNTPTALFPSPTPSPTARPVVAVLGDSFSPAEGQEVQDYNWAAIVAKRQGWDLIPFGRGGTGFTNPGQADEGDDVFGTRVPSIVAAKPSVVIVQGGTNDRNYDDTLDAARAVIAELRAGLPDARIIAVGPLATATLDERTMTPSRDALRDAASAEGAEFIDPLGGKWLQRDSDLFTDGVHPNAEGYRKMADLFLTSYRELPA